MRHSRALAHGSSDNNLAQCIIHIHMFDITSRIYKHILGITSRIHIHSWRPPGRLNGGVWGGGCPHRNRNPNFEFQPHISIRAQLGCLDCVHMGATYSMRQLEAHQTNLVGNLNIITGSSDPSWRDSSSLLRDASQSSNSITLVYYYIPLFWFFEKSQNGVCLVGKSLPHPVEVYCMLVNPPKCSII
jgi:hypothetical protein